MDDQDDTEKRLRAAVHFTVANICNQLGRNTDCTFSKTAIATLSDLTYRQALQMAVDVELFAKHAKRSAVNADDVMLCVRRNPSLMGRVEALHAETASGRRSAKKRTKAEDVE